MNQLELREQALDRLEVWRSDLITAGRRVADMLCSGRGRVTSVEIFRELRTRGFGPKLAAVDSRWMGAVFRAGRGWKRIGWEPTGSHCRPVAIWTRRRDGAADAATR